MCLSVSCNDNVNSANYKIHSPGVAEWLRHCATNRKVSGSIPGGVAGDFFRSYRRDHVPWGLLSL